MSHFSILFRFQPRNNLFRPGFNLFILLQYSLHIYYFSRFVFKSRFQVSLYTRRQEIRKIFRLSHNLTKFDRVARFRETNLTTQSVLSSEI